MRGATVMSDENDEETPAEVCAREGHTDIEVGNSYQRCGRCKQMIG